MLNPPIWNSRMIRVHKYTTHIYTYIRRKSSFIISLI